MTNSPSIDSLTSTKGKWAMLLLGALIIGLYFWRLGSIPLLDPDEGRYAEIPREMLASGDLVTPRLTGVYYFEKPPLYYWLNTGAMWAFGVNEFANRFWNTVFGLCGVLLTYVLAKKMSGRNVALLAGVALATSPLWAALSRLNSLDMTLTFFITATLVCFYLALDAPAGWRRFLSWHGAFAATALAVLTKGLVGLVIPAAVAGLFVLITGRWRILREVPWLSGTVVFLAVAAPWHILIARRNPDWAWYYFIHEHWLRYTTSVAQREEPFWFFAAIIFLGLAPLSGMMPTIVRQFSPSRFREMRKSNQDKLFLATWFAFVFLFFSASHSKLIPYILPAFPPLAILIAKTWVDLRTGTLTIGRIEKMSLALGAIGTLFFAALYLAFGAGWVEILGLPKTVTPTFLICAAILTGLLAALFRMAWKRRFAALIAVSAFMAAISFIGVILITPKLASQRSSKAAAQFLKPFLNPDDEVYSYRDFAESLPFYLQREVGVIVSRGELSFGIDHLIEEQRRQRFPSVDEFHAIWNSPTHVFFLTPRKQRKWLAQDALLKGFVLWENQHWSWISNQPLGTKSAQ